MVRIITNEEREALLSKWAAIQESANRIFSDNAAVIGRFAGKASAMFAAMLEKKKRPFERRPAVSLRLICDGEPAAKLVVNPGWSGHTKTVSLERLDVELFQQVRVVINGQEARQFSRRMRLQVKAGRQVTTCSLYESAERDAARIVETMSDFVDDHRAVFARSHDNCCMCGKVLTEELSRSRGIGPECVKYNMVVGAAVAKEWNNLVAPQLEV